MDKGVPWWHFASLMPLLLCLLDLRIATAAWGGSGSGSQEDKSAGATFFHAGLAPVTWDKDELGWVRKLHKNDFSNKEEFMGAPNLATYLGLSPIESLHMPLPLNIVLVGFSGDGNLQVNISHHELQEWFQHVDHILPHARIELSEITCSEDGQCAGLVHGRYQPTPMPSYVHLNFSCQVVVVTRRDVVQTFERAIQVFSRPVDPAIETGAQQVDAFKMDAFLDNFVGSMGLSTSYSMLVLNPSWHTSEPVYGYRTGLSRQELDLLKGQAQRIKQLMASGLPKEPLLPLSYHKTGFHHSPARPPVAGKFELRDATWSCAAWLTSAETYLRQEEAQRRTVLKAAGQAKGAAAVAHAARILLSRPASAVGRILKQEVVESWEAAAGKLDSRFRTAHPSEDCLVSNWVGAGRWLMIDLTAGGKDWGPALGGDGVVHAHTLPGVHDYFGGLRVLKTTHVADARTPGSRESELHTQLQQQKSARLPSIANRHYHAYMTQKRAAAPGAPPADPEAEERAWRRTYQENLLQAELDLTEEFALRHCNQQADPPLLCQDLREQVVNLRSSIARVVGSTGSNYEVWREHKWDIFGAEKELNSEELPDMADETWRSKELFMGELSAILSRAIRHVISPPTATWLNRSHGHDTANPYARVVHFQIYTIRDASHNTHVDPADEFDSAGLQAGLASLKQPRQVFKYSRHSLRLLDDPLLATAFAAAIKTTVQEIPITTDYIEAEMERVYVDAAELAHHLRRQFPPSERPNKSKHHVVSLSVETLEVPIFVFQLQRDVAILLDQHYNARAMDDMILVVQNAARQDEHPTGMMCGGALVARPLSPLKEALAAVLLFLGGVLPPHLGYNHRRHTVTHDWLWSVGAHPLSFTSTGVTFSQTQLDALARSQLLDALDTSVDVVNKGIRLLRGLKPSPQLHKHVLSSKAQMFEILQWFQILVDQWRTLMASAYALDYNAALDTLSGLETSVESFYLYAETIAELAEPVRCKGRVKDRLAGWIPVTYLGSAGAAILAMLYAAWPKLMALKPKLN